MICALLLIPAVAALLSLLVRHTLVRRVLLVLTGVGHTAVTLAAWNTTPQPLLSGWLMLDAAGLLFLTITSILFLACSVYAFAYLAIQGAGKQQDYEEGMLFTNAPDAVFCACLEAFLATMTLVTVSRHFGLLWVAMEATTLASAPLIYFHRHHRSLEATWKYLLICSVGIALALLGNFLMVIAASKPGGEGIAIVVDTLIENGANLNVPWLRAAFLFFLVGYGTKMGLAPLHTWLPDAHSESPSVISALLSGALLNCAFLAILRSYQVCAAAGQAAFCQDLLILFGLISIGWATIFILGQTDYKRMLAYSSVEHVGILALGVGIGAGATFGAMLHAANHSLTKAMLFLVAGNILAAYKTKATTEVRGILGVLPWSGVLWIAGLIAITGMPPFGAFLSEFTIVKAMIEQGRIGIAVAFLAMLAMIFIGMTAAFLNMAQGRSASDLRPPGKSESILAILPPLGLGALTLMLGLYLPPAVDSLLRGAAATIGGH
ncbi:MAG: proton-conducting transporter membrane subunit [Sedimentisphaerales bacterium]|nr:proton-conducting transporter membrane subunit [Sedimentisphaerales bacterium]HNY78180.1 proton-conducting transporter membrane subunit [Sedimentisphaerales bacterium]HOC65395.1 proton-conducting transporter membrane subunit [Sedimentisphaerales bacterium]HOH63218.1 proton-conducting transporter membrane subunit [Sedimentisphaerales bacterium]HPY48457.1 proton-conducting transporter membrane subunit [Sedimentisphaerales bacterium]